MFTRNHTILIITLIVLLIPAISTADGPVTLTVAGSGTYFFGGSIPLSGTDTAGNTIYLYLINNFDGSWIRSNVTVNTANAWNYDWVAQPSYFASTHTQWRTGTYTFKAVDTTTGAYSASQVFIQFAPTLAPTTVPPTEVPCSISINANQDAILGAPIILSGYSSRSDPVTLSVIENGSPLYGVIFAQVSPSPDTQTWSYAWSPVGLYGRPFPTGRYTILATTLCAAQDTTVITIVLGNVTLSASGPQNYHSKETFNFSGTCTQGNSVQLILTGEGLPSDGIQLTTIQKNRDNSWSYIWTVPVSIRGYPLLSGTYTVTAYDSSGQVYETVPITLQSNSQPVQSSETVSPEVNSTPGTTNSITLMPTPTPAATILPSSTVSVNSSTAITRPQGTILDPVINFFKKLFGWK